MILWRLEGGWRGEETEAEIVHKHFVVGVLLDIFGDCRLIVNMLLKNEIYR